MKLRCRAKSQAGQSVAELAIMGTLILFGVATILTYGQRFEFQQQAKMEAFRRALVKSYDLNSSVVYTLRKDARSVNLFGGYGEGQSAPAGATASVMWVKGAPGNSGTEDTSYSFYRINNEEIEMPRYEKDVKGHTGSESAIRTPVSIWKEDSRRETSYSSSTTRGEDDVSIRNTQASDLQDTVDTQLYVRYDRTETDARRDPFSVAPDYVYAGEFYDGQQITDPAPFQHGAYYQSGINRVGYSNTTVGTVIHRERAWGTDH